MRLLFVDDDVTILRATKRLFSNEPERWQVATHSNPLEALEAVEAYRPDVVIADIRMPEMNGLRFLSEVRRREPGAVRFLLTGASAGETALDTLAVAHQVFFKPFEFARFQAALELAYQVSGARSNLALREAIGRSEQLASLPRLFAELEALLHRADASVQDAARLLSEDTAMCARVLQLANSAWYTRGARVEDALNAVLRLGIHVVKALVLHAELFSRAPMTSAASSWLAELQRLGLSAGHVSALIWRGNAEAGAAVSACMLADLGQLVLYSLDPRRYLELVAEAKRDGSNLIERERATYGFTNPEAGAHLLAAWGLSESLVEAVLLHESCPPPTQGWTLPASVHVSRQLARGAPLGPAWEASPLAQGLVERLRRNR